MQTTSALLGDNFNHPPPRLFLFLEYFTIKTVSQPVEILQVHVKGDGPHRTVGKYCMQAGRMSRTEKIISGMPYGR